MILEVFSNLHDSMVLCDDSKRYHQTQLHRKGDCQCLEGRPNHWVGRRGPALSEAAEVSKNLLNLKEGILWNSARGTGRSKGEIGGETSGAVTVSLLQAGHGAAGCT